MLYATFSEGNEVSGHIGDVGLERTLNYTSENTVKIQADGDELARCCEILGRILPPYRVHIFKGVNAMEIAVNWY
jgi:hypothetical protein